MSVVDLQAGSKDLSAFQLLGKREHMMTSTEELNGKCMRCHWSWLW